MNNTFKRIAAGLAALTALVCLPAAESGDGAGLYRYDCAIDGDYLSAQVEALIEEYHVNGDNISVGYCYTKTGETWYYNENSWYYSASVYKVPTAMYVSEMEARGEIGEDTLIEGNTVEYLKRRIIVDSANDELHVLLRYFGCDDGSHGALIYKKYAPFDDSYYDPNFGDASYYNTPFITEVLRTLYSSPESYPGVIELMEQAEPGHWFRSPVNSHANDYVIAQKYGQFENRDGYGGYWTNTAGIIYMPNPIILTVMSKAVTIDGSIIGDIAEKFIEYTLEYDRIVEESMVAVTPEPTPEPTPVPTPEPEQEPSPAPETVTEPDAAADAANAVRLWLVIGFCALDAMLAVLYFSRKGGKARR